MDFIKQESCEDCISRQAVIDVTWEDPSYTDALNVLTEVRDKVKSLPPVTPQNHILDKIRAEIDDATEIHSDGEFYIKNIDVKRIIDKYKAKNDIVLMDKHPETLDGCSDKNNCDQTLRVKDEAPNNTRSYNVTLSACYTVEAENEDEAIRKALNLASLSDLSAGYSDVEFSDYRYKESEEEKER